MNKKLKMNSGGFNKEWTNKYCFVEINDKPICLICSESVSAMKKYNLERHYYTKHKTFDKLKGQLRLDKINSLMKGLSKQQTSLQQLMKPNNDIVQASYEVSQLIAKTLKPHSEGEFIKECLLTTAHILAPEKINLFKSVSLSRRTVSERIEEMADDITISLKNESSMFKFYSLAVDETTDISNTSQLAVFIRGITFDFQIREELLCLKSLHGTTTGEDIFAEIKSAINDFDLSYEKLSGIATDGAPSMVGSKKGLVALIKKELENRELNADKLIVCHCIIHQENLCAQSIKMKNVMSIVVKCVNFIKSKGLNNRQFKELLLELETDYGDLLYCCEVRWLSKGSMLNRFYVLKNEIKLFMDMKGEPIPELDQDQWMCDLAFLVDITSHLNKLNLKLQGPDKMITSLLTTIKSFELMSQLWILQLKQGNMVHFPTLQKQNPGSTMVYATECSNLYDEFERRFQDLKKRELEFRICEVPFDVLPENAPALFQLELIEIQSDNVLKAKYNSMPLLQFYNLYVSEEHFPNLREHTLKMASMFGTTYKCEQFFSKLNLTKNRLRARLTDKNLSNQLRVAVTSIPPNIEELSKKKQSQHSH